MIAPRKKAPLHWNCVANIGMLAAVASVVFVVSECQSGAERDRTAASDSLALEQIARAVQRFGASTVWDQRWRSGAAVMNPPYSFEVERAMIRAGGQPVLYVGRVYDVGQEAHGTRVEFRPAIGRLYPILLHTTCADSVAAPVIESERRLLSEYAVVTRVSEVLRVTGDESDSPYRPEFVAHGECLAIVPMRMGLLWQ